MINAVYGSFSICSNGFSMQLCYVLLQSIMDAKIFLFAGLLHLCQEITSTVMQVVKTDRRIIRTSLYFALKT